MKKIKLLPVIFYILQTVPAYAAPTTEHFEILDMTNPRVIRELDRVYLAHSDNNSIQQGIRLYALAIQAWNPSYQALSVRVQATEHVKNQGVLNGLIAPSMLLIEHALRANDVQFAMPLVNMVHHISPVFYNQLERKWILPKTYTSFAKFVSYSDEEISNYFERLLGSGFKAYAQGEKAAFLGNLDQLPKSSKNSHDIKDLIKWAADQAQTIEQPKNTAQDLIKDVLTDKSSKNQFLQDSYEQCLKFAGKAKLKKAPISNRPSENTFSVDVQSFQNKCIKDLKSAEDRESFKSFDITSVIEDKWVDESNCEDILQQNTEAKSRLQIKMEQDRARYGELSFTCVDKCATLVLEKTTSGATLGAAATTTVPDIRVKVSAIAMGAIGGAAWGLMVCREHESCGGKPVTKEQEILELQAAKNKAEAERLHLEREKAEQKYQQEKHQREDQQRKQEEERKRQEKQERDRTEALHNLGIKENEIIHGVDSCDNPSCDFSNVVEEDPSFKAYERKHQKEDLKKKRIQEFYARVNNTIETKPVSLENTVSSKDVDFKNCLKREWNKDFLQNTAYDLLKMTPEEKLNAQIEKNRLNHEGITTTNPWNNKYDLEQGGN